MLCFVAVMLSDLCELIGLFIGTVGILLIPWDQRFYHDVGEIFWPQPIRSTTAQDEEALENNGASKIDKLAPAFGYRHPL